MWEFESRVLEVISRTPQIKSFRFATKDHVTFRPGQFFFLTIKVAGEDAVHHFSFSNSPTDRGYVEFTKRITASDYSQALDRLKPGDWGYLRGPEGRFTLPRKVRALAFLSGGIGITPLRSMLRYIVARKLPFDVVLIYGNNGFQDIAFREELDGLAASQAGIRIEHVLSGTDVPPGWKGRRGFINRDIIVELVPDSRERLFYISGPPKMVISLEEQLGSAGVPGRQVRRDSFTGYD